MDGFRVKRNRNHGKAFHHRGDSRIRKVKVGRNLAVSARFRQFYQLTAPDFSVWPISDISSKPLFFYQNELREPPTFQTPLKSY